MNKIFFDNNSTTALDPQVYSAVVEEMLEGPSNPSSIHAYGQRAKRKLLQSRDIIANFLSVNSDEVYFTSGGTEAINTAIKGIANKFARGHIITSDLEHPAVLNSIKELEKQGYRVSYLNGGKRGSILPSDVEQALSSDTIMIVLMAVNNETGVKNDVESIAKLAHERRVYFVVDGVAWLGKEVVEVYQGITAICFSGHKIHAPKGVGILYLNKDVKIDPLIFGGGQERNMRSGTENLPAIVGMAEAITILSKEQSKIRTYLDDLTLFFETEILKIFPKAIINGCGPRISNTVNINLGILDGETLLMVLDQHGIAVSLGSACASGGLQPSRVLLNMGYSYKHASSSLRFSFSKFNNKEEISYAMKVLTQVVS